MIRPGSSISKAKVRNNLASMNIGRNNKREELPKWEDFVKARDWIGAIAFLELEKGSGNVKVNLWLAYCYFHAGEYRKAMNIYDDLMKKPGYDKQLHLYKACCHYALTNYEEAKREANKFSPGKDGKAKDPKEGLENELQVRLLSHIAQKKEDENGILALHYQLGDNIQDQLCMAGIHYLRGHYDEAIDAYKKLMLEHRQEQLTALNVYAAFCYYKQEFYDICKEMLEVYLRENKDSIVAVNLDACNAFQLYDGATAEDKFKTLEKVYEGGDIYADYDLLRHNLCVFRNGENALQVLPPLVDLFPEAKLNLIIYYLKSNSPEKADELMKNLKPISPREYMLRAVVNTVIGQKNNDPKRLELAQQDFQRVGTSPLECDTIPGRQCISSFLFLKQQYQNSIIYLNTIKEYMQSEDEFNWNFGVNCAKMGAWEQAEEALASIQREDYKQEFNYMKWMARAHVMNGHPELAWKIYMDMDTSHNAILLLKQMANDCYRKGFFFTAFKCFDILMRLDSEFDNQYHRGKIGSAVGVFQMTIVRKESKDNFDEMMSMLSSMADDPEVQHIMRVMNNWVQENDIDKYPYSLINQLIHST